MFMLKIIKFTLYAKTNLASSFGGSGGNAADRGLSVILSASEISHHQSEENMPVSSSVGSFTIVQDDV